MILYRKTPQLRVRRAAAPEPPYWAATTIAPYGSRRATPIAIDYLDLRATAAEKLEVTVCERVELPSRIEAPVLIDATGNAEVVFGRGAEIAGIVSEGMLMTSGEIANAVRIGSGIAIPVMYPLTTNLETLNEIVSQAKDATFLASFAIELDATAKNILATDDETYETLFHGNIEAIHTATERHIAALAAEHGMADFILPPRWGERSNWNAAIALTLAASRMIAMEHELELAGTLARSARIVAELDKPIARIAEAASLSIVEALDDASVDILTEWLESGTAAFLTRIDEMWRLRRD
ncbi:MAG TPA: hypothetical protein VJ901_14415 [Thermoanaerobaculia bacterium]|nr:hypothetical protein [Thermoanaerobaculia bacterium]